MLFQSFIPEFFLISAILIQLLCNSRIIFNLKYNFPIIITETCYQTIFILLFTLLILLNSKIELTTYWGIQSVSESSRWIKILIIIFSISVSYIILPILIAQKLNFFELFPILLLSIFAVFLLVGSYNLLTFYLTLEMQTICFYILASYNRNSAFSTEAGFKYFLLGSFMSGCFLLGIALLYSYLGALDLQDIKNLLMIERVSGLNSHFIEIGIGLITCTLIFKLAGYPFHYWAPDVYEGAPLSSSVIFSIVPKLGLIYFFIKWLLCIGTYVYFWRPIILLVGLGSCVVGTVLSISQKRLKRLILYSSIAQTGFVFVGLSIGSEQACTAVFVFILTYLATSVLMWGHVVLFYYFQFKINSFKKEKLTALYLTNLSGFFTKNKLWAISVLIILFSIAGIPPLTGFLAKLVILVETLKLNYFIPIILIIISAVSIFYYIRIVKIMFFEGNKINIEEKEKFQTVFIDSHLKKIYCIVGILLCGLLIVFLSPTNLYFFSKFLAFKTSLALN